MMDLKEIIKWFIPCFHILLVILKNKDLRLTFFCLFLLFNFRVGCAASASNVRIIENNAKNLDLVYENKYNVNQSGVVSEDDSREFPLFSDGSVGRTFGRPFKKMMGAMIPLIFQIGAASTWAVVAALVGIKTLFVSLIILKILLVAGAAKTFMMAERHLAAVNEKLKSQADQSPYQDFSYQQSAQNPMYQVPYPGTYPPPYSNKNTRHVKRAASRAQKEKVGALFGSKGHGHYQHGWEPPHPPHHPQKEIHLHIHNNGHQETHEEHVPAYGTWSREDATNTVDLKHSAVDPYPIIGYGPQTIKTPFGNYVKIDSNDPLPSKRK